jgi:hypothetical protein
MCVSIFRAAIDQDAMAAFKKLQTDFPASKIIKDSTCGGCETAAKSQELELTTQLWRFLRSIGPQGTTEPFENDCEKSVSLYLLQDICNSSSVLRTKTIAATAFFFFGTKFSWDQLVWGKCKN